MLHELLGAPIRAKVHGAVSGHELGLANGDIVRLAMIRAPKAPPVFDHFADGNGEADRASRRSLILAEEARKALAAVASGQDAMLFVLGTRRDAHQRLLAHVVIGEMWVQEHMVRMGWARVEPHGESVEHLSARLFAAEAKARAERAGLWREAHFCAISVRNARALREVAQDPVAARMALVEGVVTSYASRTRPSQLLLDGGTGRELKVEMARARSHLELKRGDLVEARGQLVCSAANEINVTNCGHVAILARL